MISDAGFVALRTAATVNHLLPTLTTRLVVGTRVVVRAGTAMWGAGTDDELSLSPCGLRAATARAWSTHRTGRRVRLLDVDVDPEIVVGVRPGDQIWPSGIVRVAGGETVTYAFGTILGPEVCRAESADLLADRAVPDRLRELYLRHDIDTEVTLVSAVVDFDWVEEDQRRVLDVLEALVARFAVRELVDHVVAEGIRG